ncbi:MAG: DUF3501 family protein [Xanthomonadaceae bacterium]|nr:DUF3501 family protein [Xanthomonadaceae bacterium]MDE2247149.1 DUF3501 family protein [Xanthomonadaceae bacterium]
MHKLTRADLLSLEAYAQQRGEFRARVLAHKRARKVHLGEQVTVIFEDRLTVQYQIQEMLRIERIFEADGIAGELAAYNPLIPDGRNLKATLLIEIPDERLRRIELVRLRGIEHAIALTVQGHAPVPAIADEDMARSDDEKTSAVHFLRFELDPAMIDDWRGGAPVSLASTLPAMPLAATLDRQQRDALAADFS